MLQRAVGLVGLEIPKWSMIRDTSSLSPRTSAVKLCTRSSAVAPDISNALRKTLLYLHEGRVLGPDRSAEAAAAVLPGAGSVLKAPTVS